MNLEQLRKQAKELLKGARAEDADAVQRLGGREPILANAQLALARDIEPRLLQIAAGALLEWLELRVPGEL